MTIDTRTAESSGGPDRASIPDVLAARRNLLATRLVIAALATACYAPLIGLPIVSAWIGAYIGLQAIERLLFDPERGRLVPPGRAGRFLWLALLVASATEFGAISVALVLRQGAWGALLAAIMLVASLLFAISATISNIRALVATGSPLLGYGAWVVTRVVDIPEPPGVVVQADVVIGLAVILFWLHRTWTRWSITQRSERDAIRRENEEHGRNAAHLRRLAFLDALTGIGNRHAYSHRLGELASSDVGGSLLLIDLDGFKLVNDSLGHASGDEVLVEVASRLSRSVRPIDLVTRTGGDEFAVLLTGVESPAEAARIAAELVERISRPVECAGRSIFVGASIGIAHHGPFGRGTRDLLGNADLALYQAKSEGQGRVRAFQDSLRRSATERMARRKDLNLALERNEFELHYQAQVRLADRRLIGSEALLRWRHPREGLLKPADFIADMDGTLAAGVGRWALMEACRQNVAWQERTGRRLTVGVNLFGVQFEDGNFVRDVACALETSGMDPDLLELEITETIVLDEKDGLVADLRTLRERGVGLAFDDYGTGYASLSLLRRYPLTRLKIDRSFVRRIVDSAADRSIVACVTGLAANLGLAVIGEGVETDEQAEALLGQGCEAAQGFLFGEAASATEFARIHLG